MLIVVAFGSRAACSLWDAFEEFVRPRWEAAVEEYGERKEEADFSDRQQQQVLNAGFQAYAPAKDVINASGAWSFLMRSSSAKCLV